MSGKYFFFSGRLFFAFPIFTVLILFIFLFRGIPDVSGEDAPDLVWMELPGEIPAKWTVEIDRDDPAMMKIYPKMTPEAGSGTKIIYGIIPKKSSSYVMAVAKLLEILDMEEIYARITLINWDKDDERGAAALALAEAEKADLIFSMGSESAVFVHDRYRNGAIPVVTCTNKDPVALGMIKDYESGSGTNIAYTSLNVPLAVLTDYIFRLKPELKNVGLMYDLTHEQVVATEVHPTRKSFTDMGLNVIPVTTSSPETAVEELSKEIPSVIAVMKENDPELKNSIFWVTSSTSVFSNIATINRFSENVPLLSSIPNAVTEGDDSAVLAIGIDRRNNAHLAALYAVKILRGISEPGNLKVGVVSPPDVSVNFRIARKIGLKIPFSFFESAAFIYGYDGKVVRDFGQAVVSKR